MGDMERGQSKPTGFPVPYLALGHVDAGDVAPLPNQLAQQVAVPAAAAAQVQDPARRQALGDDQTTAIVPGGAGLSQGAGAPATRGLQPTGRWQQGEAPGLTWPPPPRGHAPEHL